jgi:aminoacylase
LYYGERSPWWIWITATGSAGHGSKFIEPSATIKLLKVLQYFTDYRESEKQRLLTGTGTDGKPLRLGDVTTVNVTVLQAGI